MPLNRRGLQASLDQRAGTVTSRSVTRLDRCRSDRMGLDRHGLQTRGLVVCREEHFTIESALLRHRKVLQLFTIM